jgi:hypothetical protein
MQQITIRRWFLAQMAMLATIARNLFRFRMSTPTQMGFYNMETIIFYLMAHLPREKASSVIPQTISFKKLEQTH